MIYLGQDPVGVAVADVKTVVISEATSTTGESYNALQTAIGSAHTHWFAWVDDSTYWTGGGSKVVAIIGCPYSDAKAVYRNDASSSTQDYSNMRRFSPGSTGGAIPANTVFKYILLKES